ncbi:MAG: lipid-A-disaccharide synthase [Betaproteobacteria bacterium]
MSAAVASDSDGPSSRSPVIAMVAGEASGDLLAGLLLGGMRTRWPTLQSAGIGGARMAEHGFDAWWPSERLAVRGYVEVLRHYRAISAIRDQLRTRLLQQRPNVFIGVDAPDFNLQLETDLKRDGIRTVHFVCPSVWAWRAERLDKIRASVDHMLCLFPFEPKLLHRYGVAATFVGHPLADVIPMQADRAGARAKLGLRDDAPVLAILPGSRRSEIGYLARRFFQTVQLLLRERPALQCVVPAIPALQGLVEQIAHDTGVAGRVRILQGDSHTALAACDVTLIASGTATLEAALFKRPMVIAYNMHWLSWQIMRRQRLQPWVGLPNILCREFVVPELLQEQATPRAMADAVGQWLDAPDRVVRLQQRFEALHLELQRDTSKLATDAIETLLET